MAKVSANVPPNHPMSSSLGGYSTYKRRDSNKTIIRSKGGPSAERIKNDPSFARVRSQNDEFAGCSSAAKMLKDTISSIKHLSDFNVHARLTSLVSSIRELDTNRVGIRSIIFSRGRHLLDGFSLRDANTFDNVIATPVTFTIERSTQTAVVQLPPLTPGKNFNPAWNYPYFRFRINLGLIRDMVYVEKIGYQTSLQSPPGYTEMLDTDWYPSVGKLIGQELGLHLVGQSLDESCHLVLSIGIEFGTPSGTGIKPVKHAGAGKVLGIA